MYDRVAQVRATVTHLDLYYELERLIGRELWLSLGHGSLEAIIKLVYERTQASKRLPNDHPLRVPDEVFWTDERQNMASELAQAYVEDMTAVDWWDEQTEWDKRTYILNQEEAMNDGSHN